MWAGRFRCCGRWGRRAHKKRRGLLWEDRARLLDQPIASGGLLVAAWALVAFVFAALGAILVLAALGAAGAGGLDGCDRGHEGACDGSDEFFHDVSFILEFSKTGTVRLKGADAARDQASLRGGGTGGEARRSSADSSCMDQAVRRSGTGGRALSLRGDCKGWGGNAGGHTGQAQGDFPEASLQGDGISQQHSGCDSQAAPAKGAGAMAAARSKARDSLARKPMVDRRENLSRMGSLASGRFLRAGGRLDCLRGQELILDIISPSAALSSSSVSNRSRCRLILRHTPARTPISNLLLIHSNGTVVSR
jgi:hypothetical protein